MCIWTRVFNMRALLFLVMLLSAVSQPQAFPFSASLDVDVTPRTTVFVKGLLDSSRFTGSTRNYSTLLLEEEAGLLYVGGRGALYALNASNISTPASPRVDWDASPEQKRQCLNKGRDNKTECFNHIRFLQRHNETHLYVCGTNAFRPLCAYIDSERFSLSSSLEDGRDRCPYDPTKGYTGLLVDGEMFTASQYEFRSSPDVRRNFPFPTLRTEEAPTRWLLEADFVGSALLRESVNSSVGDDDKIYFFFTERSQEQMAYPSRTKVSRVARVCKTDWGGQRTLQRKWTSFLKARLVCSVPEYELHLNVLRSVFVLHGRDAQSSLFYGVFGLEWKNIKASAICQYAFSDVQKAFDGPYMEVQDSKWREYTGKVPEPRPGSCITDVHRSQGINSSRDLPDNVLTFARRHPLMATQVHPTGARPLMFKRSVNYVRIAVHKQPALDGNIYTVLFLGTDDGWLHRAVDVRGEMHIIEELQLFDKAQPVESLVLAPALRHIYVGSHSGVVQIPLSACRRYTSCYDCVFARDPFCGWSGRECVEVSHSRWNLTQDILKGTRGCKDNSGNVVHRRRSVMSGDDVLLQCELHSNLATPRWTLNGRELQGYGLNSGYRVGTDGLLIIGAGVQQSGSYRCFAVENAVSVLVYFYTVRVHTDPYFPMEPTAATDLTSALGTTVIAAITAGLTERPPPSLPAPLSPGPELRTYRHMEAVYISLVAVLGGLCLVLTVVLLYVSFCTRRVSRGRKYSEQGLQVLGATERKQSSHLELRSMSSHYNGRQGRRSISVPTFGDINDGFLQIVPGEGQVSPGTTPPPAPPLPMPPPLPNMEYVNGLSATLPSVLRKMNGNSYVLLRQVDQDGMSPLYHSFTEELNRILEQRKHTQLDLQPDESSI
ncbi:semaphorin-4G [Dunckerocampus dactyliophorus]|uniref:semaphorin-4G n=1 Tax=Dunckerocampus dactyliophorus TaxID=161453 RepID=UPI0024060913|nr:semaphorin-4G [Dunckerocampus dactyliophorus]XP_054608646.1 semaphorin-4G [Dunckerocampus dactyliophorus]